MESYIPPITPPERVPDNDPHQPKPRWSVLDVFKKQADLTPETNIKRPVAEHAAERALRPEHRKFAATVMMLLRGETASPQQYAAEAPPRTEAAPEVPLVERAKEVGRGVLKLIGRAKQEVQAADEREHLSTPTNIEPLADADADIRAAMQELVAPIEAMAVPQGPADALDLAVQNGAGSSRETAFLSEVASPFTRTREVVAAVAGVAAHEAYGVKERLVRRTMALRKAGVFALGASTVGGFAYTWERLLAIKKEQRALRREHKRFEAEVRALQAAEERRLNELEGSDVQHMTQPERQQYVHDVSEFAHARAAEIRHTAQARDAATRQSTGTATGAGNVAEGARASQPTMQQPPQKQVAGSWDPRVYSRVRTAGIALAAVVFIIILAAIIL